jgi:hypothetical protein
MGKKSREAWKAHREKQFPGAQRATIGTTANCPIEETIQFFKKYPSTRVAVAPTPAGMVLAVVTSNSTSAKDATMLMNTFATCEELAMWLVLIGKAGYNNTPMQLDELKQMALS